MRPTQSNFGHFLSLQIALIISILLVNFLSAVARMFLGFDITTTPIKYQISLGESPKFLCQDVYFLNPSRTLRLQFGDSLSIQTYKLSTHSISSILSSSPNVVDITQFTFTPRHNPLRDPNDVSPAPSNIHYIDTLSISIEMTSLVVSDGSGGTIWTQSQLDDQDDGQILSQSSSKFEPTSVPVAIGGGGSDTPILQADGSVTIRLKIQVEGLVLPTEPIVQSSDVGLTVSPYLDVGSDSEKDFWFIIIQVASGHSLLIPGQSTTIKLNLFRFSPILAGNLAPLTDSSGLLTLRFKEIQIWDPISLQIIGNPIIPSLASTLIAKDSIVPSPKHFLSEIKCLSVNSSIQCQLVLGALEGHMTSMDSFNFYIGVNKSFPAALEQPPTPTTQSQSFSFMFANAMVPVTEIIPGSLLVETSTNCVNLTQGQYNTCVLVTYAPPTTGPTILHGRAVLKFKVTFPNGPPTDSTFLSDSITAIIAYSPAMGSVKYIKAQLNSFLTFANPSPSPPNVFSTGVDNITTNDQHIPIWKTSSIFTHPGGSIGQVVFGLRTSASSDLFTPPVRFLSCTITVPAGSPSLDSYPVIIDPNGLGPAMFKWDSPDNIPAGTQITFHCRAVITPTSNSNQYVLLAGFISGYGTDVISSPFQTLNTLLSSSTNEKLKLLNYFPTAVRITSPFYTTSSPQTLSLEIGIPDVCTWKNGDFFEFSGPTADSLLSATLSSQLPLDYLLNSFSCYNTTTGTLRCTLLVSHPCPWNWLSARLNPSSGIQPDGKNVIRAHLFDRIPTLFVELRLNGQFYGATGKYYLDFSYNSDQFRTVTNIIKGTRVWMYDTGSSKTLQKVCPRISNTNTAVSRTTLFPANKYWLAKESAIHVALAQTDIQTGFRIYPARGCTIDSTAPQTFTLFQGFSPLYVSSPTFDLFDQTNLVKFGLNSLPLQLTIPSTTLSSATITSPLSPDLTRSSWLFANSATTSPLSSNSFANEIYYDILTVPKDSTILNPNLLCGQTLKTSCILSIPSKPYQDHHNSYDVNDQTVDITFIQAQLTVGAPISPPNVGLLTPLINPLVRYLDTLTFDFGHAPGLLQTKYIDDRDNVRVVIRTRSRGSITFKPFNVQNISPTGNTNLGTTKTSVGKFTSGQNGSYNLDYVATDNLQCFWEISKISTLAPIKNPDGSQRKGTVTIETQQIATSPSSYEPKYSTYGDSSSTSSDWVTESDQVIGVYSLPSLNFDSSIIYDQDTKSWITRSFKLICPFLSQTPIDTAPDSLSEIEFSLSIDGGDTYRTPFNQPFTFSTAASLFKTNIPQPLSSAPLRQATLSLDFGQPIMRNNLNDNILIDIKVNMITQTSMAYSSFRVGDGFKIKISKIPIWFSASNLALDCLLSSDGRQPRDTSVFDITPIPGTNDYYRTLDARVTLNPTAFENLPEDELDWYLISCTFTIGYDPSFTESQLTEQQKVTHYLEYTILPITLQESFNTDFKHPDTSSITQTSTQGLVFPTLIDPSMPCPDGWYGPDCTQVVAVTIPPTGQISTPPPLIPKLPQTTTNPTSHCDIVIDVNGIYQRFGLQYTKMCSIPTAGVLTTRKISHLSSLLSSQIQSELTLLWDGITSEQFNVCDCHCKGYWLDEPKTIDYKKCSKCIIPDGGCPSLMTPNAECTACECSTTICKKMSTYLFTTMYLKPQLLKWLVQPSLSTIPIDLLTELNNDDMNKYLYTPIGDVKYKYTTHFKAFQTFISLYYSTQLDTITANPQPTTKLQSVYISPLFEGSYTTWVVTLNVANTGTVPIQHLVDYGMIPFPETLSNLFVKWLYSSTGPLGNDSNGINTDLGKALLQLVSTPPPSSSFGSSSTSSSSGNSVSQKVPLFTSNTMSTKCISYQNYIKSIDITNPLVITSDLLQQCPLSNQYIPVLNDDGKLSQDELKKRLAQLNPLWSPCTDTSYIKYESVLQPEPEVQIVSTRQIYPQCFDFTGTDLSKHFIPCQPPLNSILYSTERVSLINPTYISTLLSSLSQNDIPTTAPPLISQLRSLQLTKFPSFPISTTIICSIPSSAVLPPPVVELNSLTATPTTLTINSHSHLSWTYQGDDTLQVTLIMKSIKKQNDGQGQFVFSQLLGTVPLSNLFSTPQVPKYTDSTLFIAIYDMIHADSLGPSSSSGSSGSESSSSSGSSSSSLGDVYDINTDITIYGYLTQSASTIVSLDPTESNTSFDFVLPMMCDQLKVTCGHPDVQFCYQGDARCRCKYGYRSVVGSAGGSGNGSDDDDEVEHPYETDPNTPDGLIDGNQLICIPMCDNNGIFDQNTGKCNCLEGTIGEHCQFLTKCQVENSTTTTTTTIMSCNNHGFIPVVSSSASPLSDTCDTTCICTDEWIDIENSPLIGFGIDAVADLESKMTKCNFCPKYPYTLSYYSQEQLDHIAEWYNKDVTTRGEYIPDEASTQTYITAGDEQSPSQPQHCYLTGTDNEAMKTQCPIKCICRKGYGGDYCQLHIAYAIFPYKPIENINYDYDEISKTLLFQKFIEEISLSLLKFDKSNIFIVNHDRIKNTITIGLYTGLDFFIRNQEQALKAQVSQLQFQSSSSSSSESQFQFSEKSQTSSESFFTILTSSALSLFSSQQTKLPTTIQPTPLPNNLDNLYTQWGQLQTTFPQTPISSQDSNQYLGSIEPPLEIQDPACYEHLILGCSGEPPTQQQRVSGKGLLIGLVVGLVSAAILFIALVLILLWCKKNKRGLWKSKEDQDRDEMSNFVPTTRKGFTGSTNAPSMTVGTLSIMPVTAGADGGVEMSNTGGASGSGSGSQQQQPPSSVQSINNHIEVKDPSLPSNIKAYKDSKGQVFYVNSETLTTSWTHPNEIGQEGEGGKGGGDDYGSGW